MLNIGAFLVICDNQSKLLFLHPITPHDTRFRRSTSVVLFFFFFSNSAKAPRTTTQNYCFLSVFFLSVFLHSLALGYVKERDEVPTLLVIVVGGNFAAYLFYYIVMKVKCNQ